MFALMFSGCGVLVLNALLKSGEMNSHYFCDVVLEETRPTVIALAKKSRIDKVMIYRVSRKSSVASDFQHAIDMRNRILFDSLIYSPSFSATQARRRIQSRDTLWTSSKVRSFHACAIASSISSLKENPRSLRICFNIPKSQKLHGLISGESGGCSILEI
jgi:hypothetical protein